MSINTFCFIAERSLLRKILEVVLKDYSGPHKGSHMRLSEQ